MDEPNKRPTGVRQVKAHRFSTESATEPHPVEETIGVVRETALAIDVDGLHTFTVMCTPESRKALAVGFLFSEGVIEGMDDVVDLAWNEDEPHVVHVKLTGVASRAGGEGRNLLIVSSCGACGDANLEKRIAALPGVDDSLRVDGALLRSANAALRERQTLFAECGGTHAAGIFDARGRIVALAEDAGRHTALDKAIGKCLLAGVPTAGRGVALSGRVSLEMVGKCARAGVELITAVSAPTSLAIDVAERWNITLCAFVRETRATVFTHPGRVIGVQGT